MEISDSELLATQNGAAPRNYVKFHKKNVFNKKGEFVEERDYIIIISPGQAKQEIDRQVQEKDKIQYAQEWAAFQAGAEQRVAGTPLEAMSMHPSRVKLCNSLYIYTVEQLAGASDAALQNVGMGGNEMRSQARAYLEKNSAEVQQLRQENTDLKAQMDDLAKKVAELGKPKKRGRPPKVPRETGD